MQTKQVTHGQKLMVVTMPVLSSTWSRLGVRKQQAGEAVFHWLHPRGARLKGVSMTRICVFSVCSLLPPTWYM